MKKQKKDNLPELYTCNIKVGQCRQSFCHGMEISLTWWFGHLYNIHVEMDGSHSKKHGEKGGLAMSESFLTLLKWLDDCLVGKVNGFF